MRQTIVIQAPVFSLSGYGAHSRDILLSLWDTQQFNIACVPTGWGSTSLSFNLPPSQVDILNFTTQNKIHPGVEFIWLQVGIPNEFDRKGKINIGVTAGIEATALPPGWKDGCNKMDAIIVPSTFIQQLFIKEGVTVPVYIVGEGVDTSIFNDQSCKEKTEVDTILDSISTEFNYLGGGQWLGGSIGEDRKGIGLLIKTFVDTFADDKRVGLVLKTFCNNNSSVDRFDTEERLKEIKGGKKFPKVYLLSGDFKNDELVSLYHHSKIKGFVSLTAGEGFGTMGLEAMACDLPVIMTGWSGHMDYMSKNHFSLVDYVLDKVPRNVVISSRGLFQPDMMWAKVDTKDAKYKMKKLYDGYSISKEKAKEEGIRIRRDWNKEVCYKQLINVINTFVAKIQTPQILMPVDKG